MYCIILTPCIYLRGMRKWRERKRRGEGERSNERDDSNCWSSVQCSNIYVMTPLRLRFPHICLWWRYSSSDPVASSSSDIPSVTTHETGLYVTALGTHFVTLNKVEAAEERLSCLAPLLKSTGFKIQQNYTLITMLNKCNTILIAHNKLQANLIPLNRPAFYSL